MPGRSHVRFLKLVGRRLKCFPPCVWSAAALEGSPNPRGIAVAGIASLQRLSEVCVTPVIYPVVVFTCFLFPPLPFRPLSSLPPLRPLDVEEGEAITVKGGERVREGDIQSKGRLVGQSA